MSNADGNAQSMPRADARTYVRTNEDAGDRVLNPDPPVRAREKAEPESGRLLYKALRVQDLGSLPLEDRVAEPTPQELGMRVLYRAAEHMRPIDPECADVLDDMAADYAGPEITQNAFKEPR